MQILTCNCIYAQGFCAPNDHRPILSRCERVARRRFFNLMYDASDRRDRTECGHVLVFLHLAPSLSLGALHHDILPLLVALHLGHRTVLFETDVDSESAKRGFPLDRAAHTVHDKGAGEMAGGIGICFRAGFRWVVYRDGKHRRSARIGVCGGKESCERVRRGQ